MATIAEAYQQAIALHQQGRLDAAEPIYRQVLAVAPNHAGAWQHLGVIALQRGDAATAIEHITRGIRLDPAKPSYYSNLGAAYRLLGRFSDAEAVLRQALSLAPHFAKAQSNLGMVLAAQDRADMALGHYREALRLNPQDGETARAFCTALGEVGLVDEALAVYGQICRQSADPQTRLAYATLLPLVYRSTADMSAWRQRLIAEVERLVAEGLTIDITDVPAVPLFSLAHQGFNDREVQRNLARLHRAPAGPALEPTPRQAGFDPRIRVGFLSAYFNSHTIGKLVRGLIANLSRDEFRVVVLSLGPQSDDEVARFIREHADEHLLLPMHLPRARQGVAGARLDILFFCELGMDPTTYTLAYSRLAPVQCVTWGHPSTTGMETMDYFVSSDAMETAAAQEHYTEKLVRLKSLTFHYYRPQPSLPPQGRDDFGLPAGHLYVCPQSIYKFHPEFDPILAEILRRDPRGQLILIRWAYPQADDLLRQRFATSMPDVLERIHFIRRLQQPEFLNLLAVSDVLLDPIHFGGGWTGCEGIALGTPIVTMPGQFLRGRITPAMYRRIGVLDCIAENPQEYVEIAVRLGTGPEHRRRIRDKILANNHRLFESPDAVEEMQAFFREAVDRCGRPGA
jgi:predicted O-linked N-acetylglucosamine transferase (SPINDLY family)